MDVYNLSVDVVLMHVYMCTFMSAYDCGFDHLNALQLSVCACETRRCVHGAVVKALLPRACRLNTKESLTWQALLEDTPQWTMPGHTWHTVVGPKDGLGLCVCVCVCN